MARKRSKSNKGVSKIVIYLIISLIIIAGSLAIFEFVDFTFESPEWTPANDECSLLMGNLLHQIKSEGDCRIKCINECGLDDRELKEVKFEAKNNSCHVCECYC